MEDTGTRRQVHIAVVVVVCMVLLGAYCSLYVFKARNCLLGKEAFCSHVPTNKVLQDLCRVLYAPAIWLDEAGTGREFGWTHTGAMPS